MIEYGYIETTPDISIPAPASTDRNLAYFYNYTNVPQTELFNQPSAAYAAAIVGGGSAVDHMMLDRGAADDYDNWEKLGNPGWGWSSLLPYFQKVCTQTSFDTGADLNVERYLYSSHSATTGRLRIYL